MSQDCKLKILDFNYSFQENVELTASSEDPNFPASNLKTQFRSRVWRSSGNFVIDSTNNTIDFKESAMGAELTAVVANGSYSALFLAAAIKAQMEAVGAETYTVTYSELDGRWTILTGGAYLDLLFATGTNSTASMGPEIGFVTGDRTGAITYTGAVKIHTYEDLVFDLKTTESIDTFTVFFDPRRGLRLSEDAEIRLQANHTLDWSSPAVDLVLDVDEEFRVISHFFSTDQNYRFWRIKIVDPNNTDLFVEVGLIYFGKSIVLSRNVQKGFTYKLRDDSVVRENIYGNSYVDVRNKVQRLEFNYSLIPSEDLRTLKKIIDRVGKTEPIVIALDGFEVLFDKDLFLIYGKFTNQLEASHQFNKYFSAPLNIEETF
jgi:hypothetical protein